jgi:hypothetical protein
MPYIETQPAPIKIVRTGDEVQIAPGTGTHTLIPRSSVPRYGVVRLLANQDGTFDTSLLTWGEMRRLTTDLPAKLGLDISYNTLKRLVFSGFVAGSRPAPNTILIDLGSLATHMEACADPDFWTPSRVARFSTVTR